LIRPRLAGFEVIGDNAKIGWWQNGDRYLHRKTLLDSLFGDLDALGYAAMLENYLQTYFPITGELLKPIVPILKSKFRHQRRVLARRDDGEARR
jgi:hypothetical protein